jgi:hypothetical protein
MKILAVALAATGCASAAEPGVAAPGARGPAEARPVDPALVALAAELGSTSPDEALHRKEHFWPLCDKNGDPLVGGAEPGRVRLPGQPLDPAGFCSSTRYERTH